VVLKVLFS